MNHRITNRRTRVGFTLLELISATTLTAAFAASSVVVIRTSHTAWRRHRDDQELRVQAVAALQHMMRRIRQAVKITSITPSTESSGELSLQSPDGDVLTWSHDVGTNQILFTSGSGTDLLADNVTEMKFTGLMGDGIGATAVAELVHAVHCTVKFNLQRSAGIVEETISCQAWLRSW